jgi:uncharacterized membrane protein YjgN (DUF898 family)
MKKFHTILLTALLSFMLFGFSTMGLTEVKTIDKQSNVIDISKVNAQQQNVLCGIFPFLNSIGGDFCTNGTDDQTRVSSAVSTTAGLIRFGLQLVFIGIIVVAIYVIIKAAVAYIRSEGNTEKVGEAKKSIQAVFAGIVALFVGIIGIILVLSFFNASGALNVNTNTGVDVIDDFQNQLLNPQRP